MLIRQQCGERVVLIEVVEDGKLMKRSERIHALLSLTSTASLQVRNALKESSIWGEP